MDLGSEARSKTQTDPHKDGHTSVYTNTHSFTPLPFALPIPTGTDNIVLSYKKRFFPSLHCGNYWINADGERHLHVKVLASLLCTADVPLSFTQITLLRYMEGERESEREKVSSQGDIVLQLWVSATKFYICPSSKVLLFHSWCPPMTLFYLPNYYYLIVLLWKQGKLICTF